MSNPNTKNKSQITPTQAGLTFLRILFLQLIGKIRRYFKVNFFPKHVAKLILRRKGECNRCGACCKIVFRCPFYFEQEGLGACKIYGKHFNQCKIFPLEPKDLVGIEEGCDYTFEKIEKPASLQDPISQHPQ